jgi:S1-C subfamily serine protease
MPSNSSNSDKNPLAELSAAMVHVVEKAADFVVLVNARRRRPSSGVAIASDLVLAADHAVEREDEIQVISGKGESLKASLLGRDPVTDLALLRVEARTLEPVNLKFQEGVVGQLSLTIGRPDTQGIQAGWVVISAIGGPVRTMRGGLLKRYYRLDATPLPGFSGGALVDANASWLGVNTSVLAMGALLSVPASLALETANSLEKYGRVKRGYLGIRSQPVEIPQSARGGLSRTQKSGLLIVNVDENSPAGQAGLVVGDILVAIGGQSVTDPDELLFNLSGDIAGKTVALQVMRGGSPVTVDVKIGER